MKLIQQTLLFCALSGLASAATLLTAPGTTNTSTGSSFVVNIEVSAVTDLYGYQFDIGFNPTVVSATMVTEGAFLPTGGATTFFPGSIDNALGTITFNAGLLGGLAGVNGGGTLIQVQFQAVAAGSSTITMTNAVLLDSFGQGITVTTTGGMVNVTGTSMVPEPTSAVLGTFGLALVAMLRRRAVR
jgi:MYXO-CTERM domain-containing protein